MSQVRYLELWQVRGLSDIEVISRMPGLQNIFLQSLRNVVRIPDLNALVGLRRLYLENMKGLQDISGLVGAPSLQEFAHAMSNLNPSDYEALVRMPSLKRASVWFGSKEKNDAFRAMADRHGIAVYEHAAFHYEVPGAA
jgi:hypothetical protein